MKRFLIALAATFAIAIAGTAHAGSLTDPFTDDTHETASHEILYPGWNLVTVPYSMTTTRYGALHPCVQTIAFWNPPNGPWFFWYRSGGGFVWTMQPSVGYWAYANAHCN